MTKSLLRRETNVPVTAPSQPLNELEGDEVSASAHRDGDSRIGRPTPNCNIVDTSSFVIPKQTNENETFEFENDNILQKKGDKK